MPEAFKLNSMFRQEVVQSGALTSIGLTRESIQFHVEKKPRCAERILVCIWKYITTRVVINKNKTMCNNSRRK